MRKTAKSWGTIWLASILITSVGLAGYTEKKDNQTGIADDLQGSFFQEIIAWFSGSGDGRGEEEIGLASAAAKEEESDRLTPEEGEQQSPSLIYTREYYSYRVRKNRDPFQPLLTEGGQMEGLTLNALTLTGILWDSQNSMAVMEDARGRGYMMKVGDKIAGARLVAIRKDAAVFRVVEFGVVHNIVKELFVKKDLPI